MSKHNFHCTPLPLPFTRRQGRERRALKRAVTKARDEKFRPTVTILLFTVKNGIVHLLLIKPTGHPGRWMNIQGGVENGSRDDDDVAMTIPEEVLEEVGLYISPKTSRVLSVGDPFDLPFEVPHPDSEWKGKRYLPAVVRAKSTIVHGRPYRLEKGKIVGVQWVTSFEEAMGEMRHNRPEKNKILFPIIESIFETYGAKAPETG